MYDKKRKMLPIVMVSLLLVFTMQVSAEESQPSSGSITIRLEDTKEEKPVEGIRLKLTKVARIEKGAYLLEEPYRGEKVDLNTIAHAEELKESAEQLAKVKVDGIEIVTDEEGIARMNTLEVGVYLITGSEISPFLVAVPTWDEESGEMRLDLEVYPKYHSSQKQIPETGDGNPVQFLWLIMGGSLILLWTGYKLFEEQEK